MLVIVDMQSFFPASLNEDVINNIVNEIYRAKKLKEKIVLVEYQGAGQTLPDIMNAIGNYDEVHTVYKTGDDGSEEICYSLGLTKSSREIIKVCGVNTTACVFSTVCGLLNKLPKSIITVIMDCCYDDGVGYGGWDWFPKERKNLSLVA